MEDVVVPKSGSVWFFDHFGWTLNQTSGPVQANWQNSELDLQFGSECSPVQVQRDLNHEPNSNLNNIIKIILIDIIIVQRTRQRGKSPMSHWQGGFPLCHVRRNPPMLRWISQSDTTKRIPPTSHQKSLSDTSKMLDGQDKEGKPSSSCQNIVSECEKIKINTNHFDKEGIPLLATSKWVFDTTRRGNTRCKGDCRRRAEASRKYEICGSRN